MHLELLLGLLLELLLRDLLGLLLLGDLLRLLLRDLLRPQRHLLGLLRQGQSLRLRRQQLLLLLLEAEAEVLGGEGGLRVVQRRVGVVVVGKVVEHGLPVPQRGCKLC